MTTQRPARVVVLGGGFGGVSAARALDDSRVHVTIVDRQNYHLFQPMLYEVATAALSSTEIATAIRGMFRSQRNVEVQLAEVTSIDVNQRQVRMLDGRSIDYDYLICALGLQTHYFGNDEWAPYAPGLKTIDDALEIRRRVLIAFELAEAEADPVKRNQLMTFVIVGGGPTGVELAGAIAEIARYTLRKDFRRINPADAKILLLEGGPRILPSYPPELSERAKRDLTRLGVDVRLDTMVQAIRREAVVAGGWVIPARTVIWAAGTRANPVLASLGAAQDRMGRVVVEPDGSVPGHPEVFVIGDAAHVADRKYGALPGVAQVAMQMGRHAARCIKADLDGRPRGAFHYWDKGQLAVIGRGHAVADIGRWHFGGFLAWFIWAFVHIFFLIGFRNRVVTMLDWAWSYVSYQRGSRIITGTTPPARPAPVAPPVSTPTPAQGTPLRA